MAISLLVFCRLDYHQQLAANFTNCLEMLMPNETADEYVRREWRELGFFYDRDDTTKEWKLIGSRSGLLRFRDELLAYAEDSANDYKAEHSHYGPYLYLKIMTWPEPGFDEDSIHGSLADLKRLAVIVGNKLTVAHTGDSVCIQNEFSANSSYALVLEVRPDDFDPASADPMRPKEGG